MKLAIIDLGSNSARMTVWEINGIAKAKTVSVFREYVRLSEGLAATGRLQQEPMERTLLALKKLSQEAEKEGCEEVICVATEAVRRAENAEEFKKKATDTCGLKVQVLTGDEEAYYDYLGSQALLPDGGLLCDVGGGSVEIADVTGKERRFFCLATGAVVMYEQFGEDTNALFAHLTEKYEALRLFCHDKIVALGGTARAVGTYFFGDAAALHGKEVSKEDLLSLYKKLTAMTPQERCQIPALGRERGDISVAGISTYIALLNITGADKLILSANGLREGMLKEWIDKRAGL